jgi:hypothetical protein
VSVRSQAGTVGSESIVRKHCSENHDPFIPAVDAADGGIEVEEAENPLTSVTGTHEK